MANIGNLANATNDLAQAARDYAAAPMGYLRQVAWGKLQEAALRYAEETQAFQLSKEE